MSAAPATPRPGERGLTIVELLVSMAIAGILISLILGVHTRMTTAFRGQAHLAELGSILRSAGNQAVADVRMAGFMMPNGFRTAAFGTPTAVVTPLVVDNDADGLGPDRFTVYYGDAAVSTRVTAIDVGAQAGDVAAIAGFAVGDLVVFTNPRIVGGDSTTSAVASYDACVLRVTDLDDSVDPNRMEFAVDPPYNTASNDHCQDVINATGVEGAASETVAYKLIVRSYRIDPDRPALGVLQRSTSFALDDWGDLAIGMINLQVATRFVETGDVDDVDADGDPTRDWYSSDNQELVPPVGSRPLTGTQIEVSVSFEVRTRLEARGVATSTSPSLTDDSDPPESVEHNELGDWAAIDLVGTADADRPEAYRGRHIFRASTTQVDLRNIGVGQ